MGVEFIRTECVRLTIRPIDVETNVFNITPQFIGRQIQIQFVANIRCFRSYYKDCHPLTKQDKSISIYHIIMHWIIASVAFPYTLYSVPQFNGHSYFGIKPWLEIAINNLFFWEHEAEAHLRWFHSKYRFSCCTCSVNNGPINIS